MILALLLQAATVTALPAPTDWSGLPTLRYVRLADDATDVSGFVRDEVKAGRCTRAAPAANGWTVTVEMIVLATTEGSPRRVIPRAIECPSVEQYAAGLVQRMARDNIDMRGAATEGWYRTTLVFAWP